MTTLASISNWHKVPELRRRVFFTMAMLAVYRVGVFVTTPGVDRNAMQSFISTSGGLLGLFNMFSGGALEMMSIFALGIMPYISASIILQLLGMVYQPVAEMKKEGEAGRRKLDQYTRYGTLALSAFQAYGLSKVVESQSLGDSAGIVNTPGIGFELMTVVTLTTGTMFLMWLGEQITERGVGNGISLIIMASIISGAPTQIYQWYMQNEGDPQPLTWAAVAAIFVGSIAIVAFFENGRRLIPIVYSRRQVGRRVYGGQQAHLPLKVNTAGVIPPIFASSLLMFPATLGSMGVPYMDEAQSIINRGDWVFNTIFGSLCLFFTFFYTGVVFNPVDVAENLKKQQANIPGVRPGKQTAEFIDHVMQRITACGAVYVAFICVVPGMLGTLLRVQITFGGTTIMIVVGVALDTLQQIEGHLIKQSYDGIAAGAKGRVRGRRQAQARAGTAGTAGTPAE